MTNALLKCKSALSPTVHTPLEIKRQAREALYVHKGAGHAYVGFPFAEKLDFALQDVEGFVPVVTMRWRPRSLVTLLQCDSIALRCVVRRQYGHLRAEHAQGGVALIGCQNKGLNFHDLTT